MITKYIGSPLDLKNCKSITIVALPNNSILMESDISLYTEYYLETYMNAFCKRADVIPGTTVFECEFTDEDRNQFAENNSKKLVGINHIILYDFQGNPIGFTNLTQNININKYQIRSMKFDINFDIQTSLIAFEYNVSYANHIAASKNKLTHKHLLSNSLGVNKATTFNELNGYYGDTKLYSNNVSELYRKGKIGYYSGNLTNLSAGLRMNEYQLTDESDIDLIVESDFRELIHYKNLLIMLCYKLDKLYIYKLSRYSNVGLIERVIDFEIKIDDITCLGSNFILIRNKLNQNKYNLIDTKKLLDYVTVIGKGRSSIDYISESLMTSGNFNNDNIIELDTYGSTSGTIYHYKNPITKEISFYKRSLSGAINPLSVELSDILNEFGISSISGKIIYAAKGLLFCLIDGKYKYFTYSLPPRKSDTSIEMSTSSSERDYLYYDINGNRLPDGQNSVAVDLQNAFDEILFDTDINYINFISTDLFMIDKSNISWEQYLSTCVIPVSAEGETEDLDILIQNGDLVVHTEEDIESNVVYGSKLDYYEKYGNSKYIVYISSTYKSTPYDSLVNRVECKKLKGISGSLNYDKIFHKFNPNLKDIVFLNCSIDGNPFGYLRSTEIVNGENQESIKIFKL